VRWHRERPNAARALALLCGGVLLCATPAHPARAQVMQLNGGASSVGSGYGGSATLFGDRYQGWLGLGYRGGWQVGTGLRWLIARDTLRLGDDAMTVTYPTDIFGTGYNLLLRGAGYSSTRGNTHANLFGGFSGVPSGAAIATSRTLDRPVGVAVLTRSYGERVTTFFHAVAAGHQTLLGGVSYRAPAASGIDLHTAIVGGEGAGRAYGAISGEARDQVGEVHASYTASQSGFRRADVTAPVQTELDHENFTAVLRPTDWLALNGAWQNFRRDSAAVDSLVERARGVSGSASVLLASTRGSAGVYRSQAAAGSNVSGYLSLGHTFADRFAIDAYAFQSSSSTGIRSSTQAASLHERVTQRLELNQLLTIAPPHPGVALGGTFVGDVAEISLEYQMIHTPFDVRRPFQRALWLGLRLQLFGQSAGISTSMNPDGSIGYTASTQTFLYLSGVNGAEPRSVFSSLPRFLIRGVVVDQAGAPVSGAALRVGSQLVYTNSAGEFFVRVTTSRVIPLVVEPDQFLTADTFVVTSAPATVTPAREPDAQPVRIVLRRAGA
jgi:hypothetical protein